ncbi:hypothetical protein TREMEDRAFT_31055 [Tremella mesenterica DSM 1558]|uniref:uncharacterized protein n=1 Tax=Tremella mesenterica (strain ATCC 24925 / CBS 8224 / DSM 1558 / NBRC 9311 / NRRL Y-6157 / RJB 2259-6 / UBC 559-6) TaxID=578456 RepID=UPI0003F4A522|nr:uncharacterized protein TREMEDRAFT_31055 [Tremella mesenterica DSM 1558]EIW68924.1 hypothetical protein TREMEDRAFT_31055 [Tremella mesenterica DSM 1558]
MSAQPNYKSTGLPRIPYVRLGKSGLKVSRLILGMASYGTKSDVAWRIEEEEALKHLKHAYDMGINTFDTSNFYCNGVSEEILGKFVKTVPRESVVIMTKSFHEIGDLESLGPAGWTNNQGNNRKHIIANVNAALKRLQTDYIDVLQLHRFDYETEIEETMQALHDVVQAGYVRYIGMSSCFAWQLHAMQNYAINNKLTPFVNCQNFYNALYREEEREMMPLLNYLGIGSTPWSPVAKGWLARPWSQQFDSNSDKYHTEGILGAEWEKEIVARTEQLALKRGYSMAQIALAWVLHKSYVCAPIIGATSLEKMDQSIQALDIELSEEEIAWVEEPYQS